jgi:DDE family transposase
VWGLAGAPLQDGTVVMDLDATLVDAHSEKQDTSRTWKKGFGFHPLLGFVDYGSGGGGGEPVGEVLRPGKAGSNTAADHVVVVDTALAQIPEHLRRPDAAGRVAVLVRTDGAGATKAFAKHLAAAGIEFSLGANLGYFGIHAALALLPPAAWTPAYQARKPRAAEHGVQIEPRDGAWVAELTGLVDLSAWPAGTRLILRKERPHPGAQLRTTDIDGMRITGFLTNTATGQLPDLELRHRRHARVEDRIRTGKDTGLRNLPYHDTAPNRVWLAIAALAQDLLAWCARLALPAPAASYEPKRLRLRILTVAGRIVDHRPTTHPQDRPHLALGRGHHHRTRPTLRAARPLTPTPHPDDPEHRPARRAGIPSCLSVLPTLTNINNNAQRSQHDHDESPR